MLRWDLGMKREGSICTVFPPALSGNWRGTFFIAVAQCQKMNLVSVLIKSHHSVIRLPGEQGRFPTAGRWFLWTSEFVQNCIWRWCSVRFNCSGNDEVTKPHNRKLKHKTNQVKVIQRPLMNALCIRRVEFCFDIYEGHFNSSVLFQLRFNGQVRKVKRRPAVAGSHMYFYWEHLGFSCKTQQLF